MIPSVSTEIKTFLDTLRQFVREEIIPLEKLFLEQKFGELEPQLQALRQKAKSLGFWLPQIHEEYGGMGLSLVEHGYVSEILGQTPIGHYVLNCQAPDAGNMEILIEYGTEEQKERFLKPLLAGEIRSCFSMTEPENPGSNPTWMSTTAVKEGDSYIVDGHKWFTSAADGSAFAIVMAVTDPRHESKYRRASMIIVPTDTPGFRLVRNISVMGETGHGFASHGEVQYDECRVPQGNLLGQEGDGFIIAQQRLGPGRIHHCMRWIGICERSFDLMCRYALLRQVAPGNPATEQTVQNWAAESRADINAARLMVLQAAHKIDQVGSHAARDEISLIKFFVAGVLQKVLDRAIQIHGALGMTDDLPLAYWYRHERAARIYDGPDEVHKRSVAQRIFERYQRGR